MDATEHALNQFSTRVRQMLLQYKELKKENAELYAMVDEREEQSLLRRRMITIVSRWPRCWK